MFSTKGYVKLTKEVILERVSPVEIFYFYIPQFDGSNKSFKSDLYADKNPGCRVRVKHGGDAYYKDFGTGDSYDCFSYVQTKYNCSFTEALLIIDADFNLGISNNKAVKPDPVLLGHLSRPTQVAVPTKIQIRVRPWNQTVDKDYWGQYGLTCATLNKFNIIPCSHVWIQGVSYTATEGNPFYAFRFGKGVYKILSPYALKAGKWKNNATQEYLQGYKQLRRNGDLLIITKSLKDVMILDVLGYNAIAPQSELTKLSTEIVEELKRRFKKIVVLYDNDSTGKKGRDALISSHGFEYIEIPGDTKDISDYVKENDMNKATKLLNNLLNGI